MTAAAVPPSTINPWPRRMWIGLVVVAGYVALAAGVGNIASSFVSDDQPTAQFALGHLIPLPIAIGLLLFVIKRSGWGSPIWRERSVLRTTTPRRWWLLSFPVLAVILSLGQIADIPWSQRSLSFLIVVAVGTLMVGLGEELAIRGVLLTAVRGHHGELTALIVTSIVFAVAHIPGSIIAGAPIAVIAIEVFALTAVGTTYYWIRRVTGHLWPAILIHAFSDWVLYLGSGEGTPTSGLGSAHTTNGSVPLLASVQILLWLAAAISIISAIREDRRNRNLPQSA